MALANILEAAMLVCFGLSWPMNAWKSYKARTAAGTSWQFLALICAGYVAGIAAKFVSGNINWVLIVYFLNVACLAVNWVVYFRNRKLDALRAAAEVGAEAAIAGAAVAGAAMAEAVVAEAAAAELAELELAAEAASASASA